MVKKVKHKRKEQADGQTPEKGSKPLHKKKPSGRSVEDAEIKSLEARIKSDAPRTGCGAFASSDTSKAEASSEGGPALTSSLFADLPISKRTIKALKAGNFEKMTEIQRGVIPHALAGRDILGEARTGSGKTLAFLVPLVELLFRSRWSSMDGLGGIVVSPTRELSYQIYRVVREIADAHELSAGCIVGGRDLREEQKTVTNMTILVASPGRLLQHLDESVGFDASNLQMLALDEADRILDFGFQETVHHILSHLPRDRQTLLFSATLHTSIHRLGKMALKAPEIVSVHKDAKSRTPEQLKQVCMMVPLEQKMDVLFSFLRSHSQKKMIVFVSSCKQVRFLYETFRQLKPGPAIMELHGKQSLTKRLVVFEKFSEKERAVALFCTDIAARGVDFPVVDWVLQLDCPDAVESYVHRVGRTARLEAAGSSALFLLPSEEAFIGKLKAHRVNVKSISAKQGKVKSIQSQIQGVIAGDQSIKHLAQKALISYVRSIALMKDKEVFKTKDLPLEAFANSIGLHAVPDGLGTTDGVDVEQNPEKMIKNKSALHRLKEKIKAKKQQKKELGAEAVDQDDTESDDQKEDKKRKLSRWERRQRRIEQMEAMPAREVNDEEDDLLVPVAKPADEPVAAAAPAKKKLKLGKDGIAVGAEGKHTYFSEKGNASSSEFAQLASSKSSQVSVTKDSRQAFLSRISADLAERDGDDAATSRARIQEQHQKKRRKAKDARRDEDGDVGDDMPVMLGGGSSGSRSPSPCSGSDGGASDNDSPADDEEPEPRPTVAAKNNKVSKKPQKTTFDDSNDAGGGGGGAGGADDLGALERQALSKLSGLF